MPQFAKSFDRLSQQIEKGSSATQFLGKVIDRSRPLVLPPAGYQLKRGAAKPLLEIECEPGVTIRWALQITHPFTVQPEIPLEIFQNINVIASGPLALVDRRLRDLQ